MLAPARSTTIAASRSGNTASPNGSCGSVTERMARVAGSITAMESLSGEMAKM